MTMANLKKDAVMVTRFNPIIMTSVTRCNEAKICTDDLSRKM